MSKVKATSTRRTKPSKIYQLIYKPTGLDTSETQTLTKYKLYQKAETVLLCTDINRLLKWKISKMRNADKETLKTYIDFTDNNNDANDEYIIKPEYVNDLNQLKKIYDMICEYCKIKEDKRLSWVVRTTETDDKKIQEILDKEKDLQKIIKKHDSNSLNPNSKSKSKSNPNLKKRKASASSSANVDHDSASNLNGKIEDKELNGTTTTVDAAIDTEKEGSESESDSNSRDKDKTSSNKKLKTSSTNKSTNDDSE